MGDALAWFRRADHLGPSERRLDESVRDLVEGRLGWRPDGPIRLLTHLRYFGLVMNPVSFYYCLAWRGSVEAVVAEVTNTPWRERHCYVLDPREHSKTLRSEERQRVPRLSVFGDGSRIRWRLTVPGERLALGIDWCPLTQGVRCLARLDAACRYQMAADCTFTIRR